MHTVAGQDAAGLVVGVVLLEMVGKRLAQVAELRLRFLGDLAADVGILVEPGVEIVRAVVLLTDDAGRAENDASAGSVDLADDLLETSLEILLGGAAGGIFLAVPNVVDANVDNDEGGLLGEDIFFEAALEIGNLVAADTCADDFDAEVLVFFGQRLACVCVMRVT